MTKKEEEIANWLAEARKARKERHAIKRLALEELADRKQSEPQLAPRSQEPSQSTAPSRVEPPKSALPRYLFKTVKLGGASDSVMPLRPQSEAPEVPTKTAKLSKIQSSKSKAQSQPKAPEKKNSWTDWVWIGAILFATVFLGLYGAKWAGGEKK